MKIRVAPKNRPIVAKFLEINTAWLKVRKLTSDDDDDELDEKKNWICITHPDQTLLVNPDKGDLPISAAIDILFGATKVKLNLVWWKSLIII